MLKYGLTIECKGCFVRDKKVPAEGEGKLKREIRSGEEINRGAVEVGHKCSDVCLLWAGLCLL